MSVFMTDTASMRWGRKIDENIEKNALIPQKMFYLMSE